MNKISTWLFISIVSALIFSCTAESSKSSFIKGTVTVEGSPVSGALVSIYVYPELNDTLEYLQELYPNIGCKVTRELAFDKNENTPVAQIYTDSKGNFETDELESGKYVVVINSEGAVKQLVDIAVVDGETNIGTINYTKIFRYTNNSLLTGNVLWPAGSSVYIEGKIILDEMANLFVEEGVQLFFSDSTQNFPFGELTIYGKAEFFGSEKDFITISGAGKFMNAWNSIKLGSQSEGVFRYCAFYDGRNALLALKADLYIENCVFLNNTFGLYNEISNKELYNKLSFVGNAIGCYNARPDSLSYSSTLFFKNQTGMNVYGPGCFFVNNILFSSNKMAYKAVYDLYGSIFNCSFFNNSTSIYLSGEKTFISNCEFKGSDKYDIVIMSEHNSVNSQARFCNNNFFSLSTYNVFYLGFSWGWNGYDLEAYNNYWNGTTDSLLIGDKIYDKTDAGPNMMYTGRILFWPPSSQIINDAGVYNM